MAHISQAVEYGLHCLLWLVDSRGALSSRELAEMQGLSPSFVAKIFPKLEKAGIVAASEGNRGGYRLALAPEKITLLQVVDAIEGDKPLFDCAEVRSKCVIFNGSPPSWSTAGVCSIHAAMLKAEKAMRQSLGEQTLGQIAGSLQRKAPAAYFRQAEDWLAERRAPRPRIAPD